MSLVFLIPQSAKSSSEYCVCDLGSKGKTCFPTNLCGKCGSDCTKSEFDAAVKATKTIQDSSGGTSGSSNSSKANTSPYLGGTIPNCTDLTKNGCNDVSIFLISAIGVGQYVFGIIGVLALVMFVYGGLVWITANGNPEKVKQGMGIFMSAVIGLVIVFSAYMLVKYFGSSILNIGSEYQLQ